MNITHTNTTHTNTTYTTTPSREEQEDIHRVTALCHLVDGLSLSYPGGGDEYWILEEGTTAAAFLAMCKTEITIWECCAFTHPDSRRKGYFFLLLEQVYRYSEALGEPELCSVTNNKYPAAMAVLRELEAELWSEEYIMEYDVPTVKTAYESGTSVSQTPLPDAEPDTEPDTELDMGTRTTPEGLPICARIPGDSSLADGNGITSSDINSGASNMPGACVSRRLSLSGTSVYLYNLETVPAPRRRGLAGRFLAQFIRHLERKGIRRTRLQAFGPNKPALRLYRKTESRITETPFCYLY